MYKLVYKDGFSNFKLEFKLCGPNFVWPSLQGKVYNLLSQQNFLFLFLIYLPLDTNGLVAIL